MEDRDEARAQSARIRARRRRIRRWLTPWRFLAFWVLFAALFTVVWEAIRGDRIDSAELQCMALNIYFESRSEPSLGQRAVAHVTLNRVADRHYPSTVCAVVKQGEEQRLGYCQFSWWCDGRSDEPKNARAWRTSQDRARSVMSGRSRDPTGGALFYHATYVSPHWAPSMERTRQIGTHIFYKRRKRR